VLDIPKSIARAFPKLNKRQWAILVLVAQGFKNKEIAEFVGTTEHVVKNYMRYLYDMFGFYNRVELALWYVRCEHKHGNEL